MFIRRAIPLLVAALTLTACGDGSAASPEADQPLAIGSLPAPVDSSAGTDGTTGSTIDATTTTLAPEDTVGAVAKGNRVLLMGDSVMASTTKRYTNDMCEALVPLGWRAEVEAESGKFVKFGSEVLDTLLVNGWDAAVILLGNNYIDGDQSAYRKELTKIIERLSPRPVVLGTVSEFTPSRGQVNEVIHEMKAKYDNVFIADWAEVTAHDDSLTGSDNLHLTNKGRVALAETIAQVLGTAPAQPGKCLESVFIDDSMFPVTGTTVESSHTGSTTTTAAGTGSTDAVTTTAGSTAPTTTAGSSATTTTAKPGNGNGGGGNSP